VRDRVQPIETPAAAVEGQLRDAGVAQRPESAGVGDAAEHLHQQVPLELGVNDRDDRLATGPIGRRKPLDHPRRSLDRLVVGFACPPAPPPAFLDRLVDRRKRKMSQDRGPPQPQAALARVFAVAAVASAALKDVMPNRDRQLPRVADRASCLQRPQERAGDQRVDLKRARPACEVVSLQATDGGDRGVLDALVSRASIVFALGMADQIELHEILGRSKSRLEKVPARQTAW